MKVLFLDFDGVLNSHHSILFNKSQLKTKPKAGCATSPNEADLQWMLDHIDERLAWNLKFVTEKCLDLKFVISSTWRKMYSLDRFTEVFRQLGFRDNLILGVTPLVVPAQEPGAGEYVPRIAHINAWRKDNQFMWSDCVILDDHSVAPNCEGTKWLPEEPEWVERFVQTDQRDGFTYARAWDVLDLLMGHDGWKAPIIMM
jgi:hypothetical protein